MGRKLRKGRRQRRRKIEVDLVRWEAPDMTFAKGNSFAAYCSTRFNPWSLRIGRRHRKRRVQRRWDRREAMFYRSLRRLAYDRHDRWRSLAYGRFATTSRGVMCVHGITCGGGTVGTVNGRPWRGRHEWPLFDTYEEAELHIALGVIEGRAVVRKM